MARGLVHTMRHFSLAFQFTKDSVMRLAMSEQSIYYTIAKHRKCVACNKGRFASHCSSGSQILTV
eukprot:scaffold660_cov365-Pavlova_lutheri.AAC.12